MDRRTKKEEDESEAETTVIPIDRRDKGLEFPDMFAEIIKIFAQTRAAVFHATDVDGPNELSLEIDTASTPPELRLNISTDRRGVIPRSLGMQKDKITTQTLLLTGEGYRISTPDDIRNHRFIAGSNRLRLVQYNAASIPPIHVFLRKFHGLLKQATSS